MKANTISLHAINRFRERFGAKQSDTVIRRDITGLLYSAEEVRRKDGPEDGAKYFQTDGVVFVIEDGVVVTVLFGRDEWEKNCK